MGSPTLHIPSGLASVVSSLRCWRFSECSTGSWSLVRGQTVTALAGRLGTIGFVTSITLTDHCPRTRSWECWKRLTQYLWRTQPDSRSVAIHHGETQHFSGSISKKGRDGRMVISSTLEDGEEMITADPLQPLHGSGMEIVVEDA